MRAPMHLAKTVRPAYQTSMLEESNAFALLGGRVYSVKVSVNSQFPIVKILLDVCRMLIESTKYVELE